MRIGILGGTFDPIHMGHLILAQEAFETLPLTKVIFVPCHMPPHKAAKAFANSEDRYQMAVLATQENPSFEVSRVEIDRGGISYSVETLRELRKKYGEDADLFFITGSDSLEELVSWKDIDDIFRLAKFVVAQRSSYPIKELPEGSCVISIASIEISSSRIRQRIKEGKSIRYLVPELVERYIIEKKLYQ